MTGAQSLALLLFEQLHKNKTGVRVTADDLATRVGRSVSYVAPVLSKLTQLGVLSAQSGNTGGYELVRRYRAAHPLPGILAELDTRKRSGIVARAMNQITWERVFPTDEPDTETHFG